MEFVSPSTVKMNSLRKELEVLKSNVEAETTAFAESMKTAGWVEVYKETEEGYGDYWPCQWLLFSPSVPASVVEDAKNDRYFDPEDEGVAEEDYYDLT